LSQSESESIVQVLYICFLRDTSTMPHLALTNIWSHQEHYLNIFDIGSGKFLCLTYALTWQLWK